MFRSASSRTRFPCEGANLCCKVQAVLSIATQRRSLLSHGMQISWSNPMLFTLTRCDYRMFNTTLPCGRVNRSAASSTPSTPRDHQPQAKLATYQHQCRHLQKSSMITTVLRDRKSSPRSRKKLLNASSDFEMTSRISVPKSMG